MLTLHSVPAGAVTSMATAYHLPGLAFVYGSLYDDRRHASPSPQSPQSFGLNKLFVQVTMRVEDWVEECRKLVVPEKLEPASVAEILKGMGYGGSGVVLKYGKEASLPFPRHSHNTPAVELVMGGVFKFTFNDGLVCRPPS